MRIASNYQFCIDSTLFTSGKKRRVALRNTTTQGFPSRACGSGRRLSFETRPRAGEVRGRQLKRTCWPTALATDFSVSGIFFAGSRGSALDSVTCVTLRSCPVSLMVSCSFLVVGRTSSRGQAERYYDRIPMLCDCERIQTLRDCESQYGYSRIQMLTPEVANPEQRQETIR